MKTFIAAPTLVFALATGASIMTLPVHTDRAHIDKDSASSAVHQKAALIH
jgi:hypothetical protein